MPDLPTDASSPSCFPLFSRSGIEGYQQLGPVPFVPRAHAREGFTKGSPGNPHDRPRGIRNPSWRVPNLAAWPLKGAQGSVWA